MKKVFLGAIAGALFVASGITFAATSYIPFSKGHVSNTDTIQENAEVNMCKTFVEVNGQDVSIAIHPVDELENILPTPMGYTFYPSATIGVDANYIVPIDPVLGVGEAENIAPGFYGVRGSMLGPDEAAIECVPGRLIVEETTSVILAEESNSVNLVEETTSVNPTNPYLQATAQANYYIPAKAEVFDGSQTSPFVSIEVNPKANKGNVSSSNIIVYVPKR